MKKTIVTCCLVPTLVLSLASPSLAAHELSPEERLNLLEQRQAELYTTLAEKKTAGLHTPITDRINISGLIEVEGFWSDESIADVDDKASDLTLATAQLGLDAQVNDQLNADVTLLFEEGEDFTIDEAFVTYERGPLGLQAGLLYVPFGVFNTNMITSPLTLELGETQDVAIVASYGTGLFSVSGFVFNGEAKKKGKEDQIGDFGLALSMAPTEGVEFGASALANIASTDAELLAGVDNEYKDAVGGWSAYALVTAGPVEFSAEILAAMDNFELSELDVDNNGKGDQPMAWNLELTYSVEEDLTLAARVEGSDELEAPELQYGIATSWGIMESTALAFEYLHAEFDDAITRNGERDQLTAQLAVEF